MILRSFVTDLLSNPMKNNFASLLNAIQDRLAGSQPDAQQQLGDYTSLEPRVLFSAAPLDLDVELAEPEADSFDDVAESDIGFDLFEPDVISGIESGISEIDGYLVEQPKSLIVIDSSVDDIGTLIQDLELNYPANTFEIVLLAVSYTHLTLPTKRIV